MSSTFLSCLPRRLPADFSSAASSPPPAPASRPASVGENVTVCGLDWRRLEPGSRLALGDEAVIAVTRYTSPCKTIADSFAGRDFRRISQREHPGYSRVYARVIRAGRLVVGQSVRLLDGSHT